MIQIQRVSARCRSDQTSFEVTVLEVQEIPEVLGDQRCRAWSLEQVQMPPQAGTAQLDT